jgi:hypothetical protein
VTGAAPTVGSHYKSVIFGVIAIFFGTLATYVVLAVFIDQPSDSVKNVEAVLDFAVKASLGGYLGLLGAKVP